MSQPEIEVIRPIRPDEAMEQLGVKKDAFYDRLKYLGIKLDKDDDSKTFLTQAQFEQMEALGQHIRETGKKDGFLDRNSALTVNQDSGLAGLDLEVGEIPIDEPLDDLIQAAGRLAAHRLTAPLQVIHAIADQMTYDDLPDNLRQEVDSARERTQNPPKFQAQSIASNLLNQWREQRAEAQEATL
ncbi:MAG: hypothetical protein HC860_13710 [Alkalinema sp. RU_4_3]|nr:hypothetical protein [Alkalinema sp. RU_4_3]NJR71414.1 hypothetical protein [Synechococcales cyanobacterium CRU_2_2]